MRNASRVPLPASTYPVPFSETGDRFEQPELKINVAYTIGAVK